MTSQSDVEEQSRVLTFWFGEDQNNPDSIESRQKVWYTGGDEIDRQIREDFYGLYERAANETLLHWADTADGAVALVIMLDQFSRNLYRGTAQAFAQDPMARAIAKRALNLGLDREMSVPARIFLLHPFHHGEELADQMYGCNRLQDLINEGHSDWRKLLESSVEWFDGHCEIVKRFSRFPHRNEALGRPSTKQETAFLAESSGFGQ